MAATTCHFLIQGGRVRSLDLLGITHSYYSSSRLRTRFKNKGKETKDGATFKISRNFQAENVSGLGFRKNAHSYGAERSLCAVDLVEDSLDLAHSNAPNQNLDERSHPYLPNETEEGAVGGSASIQKLSENEGCIQHDSLALLGDNAENSLEFASENDITLIAGVLEEARQVHGAKIARVLLTYRQFKVRMANLLGSFSKRPKQETSAGIYESEDKLSKEVPQNGAALASIPSTSSHSDKMIWEDLKRLWNEPSSDKIRVLVSMANLTVSLPTFLTRTLPLMSNLRRYVPLKSVSFSVLAPVLFGGGMIFKSSIASLTALLPRLGMSLTLLWVLWGLHALVREAVLHLKEKGAVEMRFSNTLMLLVELAFGAAVGTTILASIGVNLSSLFVPFILALAFAGKDVWQNQLAGFFLFAAQPFQPGQTLSVPCDYISKNDPSSLQTRSSWFEGTCETVDLRYTVLRNGQTRLIVPNSIFVNQAFMIVDTVPCVAKVVTKKRITKLKEKSRRPNGVTDEVTEQSGSHKPKEPSSDVGD